MHLHDLLDHLVRALECVCREFKPRLTQQDLLSGLTVEMQKQVKELIKEFATKFRELADDARGSGNVEDYRLLATIVGQAETIAQANKLGLAVVALLNKLVLHDAEVLDKFFVSKGRPDWATLVSKYRNATIHEGYLDFSKKHDPREVVQLCLHLKDVLTRIILKKCGYSGTYDCLLRHIYGPQPIDWVCVDTDASQLGFT